jgi:NAD(P)-dependent dehydrogenase (short-subunit alcohol dehydrogenase family)
LAAEGALLGIAARTRENVEARAEELRREGGTRTHRRSESCGRERSAPDGDRVIAEYGRIDVLVNLAGGLTRYMAATEHTLEDWNHEMANNLLATFLCARSVFPRMRDAGGGSIINFARAGTPQSNMVAYNCAKAGVEALTRTLALEGRDHGIRVNAVAPGLVDTASNIEAMKPKDLKKWAKREDIARVVIFLAADASAGVTGQTIPVTGWGI